VIWSRFAHLSLCLINDMTDSGVPQNTDIHLINTQETTEEFSIPMICLFMSLVD
jgi:hypothetical protein